MLYTLSMCSLKVILYSMFSTPAFWLWPITWSHAWNFPLTMSPQYSSFELRSISDFDLEELWGTTIMYGYRHKGKMLVFPGPQSSRACRAGAQLFQEKWCLDHAGAPEETGGNSSEDPEEKLKAAPRHWSRFWTGGTGSRRSHSVLFQTLSFLSMSLVPNS